MPSVIITFSAPPEWYIRFEKYAKISGGDRSRFIREAIAAHMLKGGTVLVGAVHLGVPSKAHGGKCNPHLVVGVCQHPDCYGGEEE